jgi:branched-chain amino acid transport system substrate-binding protein
VDASQYLPVLRNINFSGVTGQIAFDAQGNLKNPSFTVYKVVNGKWQPQTVVGGAAK